MHVKFKVIIPSYNSVKWIRKTLTSVSEQTYPHYEVCVIDDASTQAEQREIIQEYAQKKGWKTIFREKNIGGAANVVEAIRILNPLDEDVILLLDGDDWLYHRRVFEKVARAYSDPAIHMTYGQFVTFPRWQLGIQHPFSEETLREKNFREVPWIFSHLRTFKHKLWKRVRDVDLRDADGHYYRTAWDLAFIFPMIEMMGGEGIKFMEDILYVYNLGNPLNDEVAHSESQNRNARLIRQQSPYTQVFSAKCVHNEGRLLPKLHNRWITFYRKIITPQVYHLAWNKLKKCLKTS